MSCWLRRDLAANIGYRPKTTATLSELRHRVPLTSTVLEILNRRARAENADDQYVFSNHRHTCVADRAKKAAAILCKGGVSFHFRAHDLRRTAASHMGEAGVDRSTSHTCLITAASRLAPLTAI